MCACSIIATVIIHLMADSGKMSCPRHHRQTLPQEAGTFRGHELTPFLGVGGECPGSRPDDSPSLGAPCVEAWVRKGDMGTSLVAQDGKESACNAADLGLIPKLGRSPGEGNGNPLQYSYLENPMD